MDTTTHTNKQTHRIHSYNKKEREREKEGTSAKTRVCHRQLTGTGHSQTQILELKRTTTLSKQSPQ